MSAYDALISGYARDVAKLRADLERVASERDEARERHGLACGEAEIERLTRERDEARRDRDTWEQMCSKLRVQESRISGTLCDAGDVRMGSLVGAVEYVVRDRARLQAVAEAAARVLRAWGEPGREDGGPLLDLRAALDALCGPDGSSAARTEP